MRRKPSFVERYAKSIKVNQTND